MITQTARAGERLQLQQYNAAVDLIDHNLGAGRGGKTAVIDDDGSYTYAELSERVDRSANALRELALEPEQRLMLCLTDSIDFPACFLGAIKAGIVPVPVNTMCPADDYAWMLADSRAKAAIVSSARLPEFEEAARMADWPGRIVVSGKGDGRLPLLAELLDASSPVAAAATTRPDDVCFWLYSSGSTGKPKGVVHLQTSLMQTAKLFGQGILGITESDLIYSSAKLFFAYGLGNALTFPLAAGATSILHSARVTPQTVGTILRKQAPTIFCGVPTLFNSLLASADLPGDGEHNLRFCTSAGEALPERVGRVWRELTGVDIVDGIGSTEMLHIYVSNRPGSVRYGSTGRPVPGYHVRLTGENGADVALGEIGEMMVSGPTSAACYWNNRERTRSAFLGEWVRTGDKFRETPEGYFVHCGRSDDMLKVSGNWVSPVEVEAALMTHDAVFEAGVIGVVDENGLIKPKAFLVVKPGVAPDPELARALQNYAGSRLPQFKCPHWIEFVEALPKTATGKLQRYRLHGGSEMSRTGVVR